MNRVIGVDFGNTLTIRLPGKDRIVRPAWEERLYLPDALRVIKRLIADESTRIYIISKVNEEEKKMVSEWLDKNNFYGDVGLTKEDVFFCQERNQKGNICRDLGVTHHIDDRPEVMAHLDPSIKKYLFNPHPEDVVTFFNQLNNVKIVSNWNEVEHNLFPLL